MARPSPPVVVADWKPNPSDGEAYAAVVRIARKLVSTDSRVIGLAPADDRVAVPPVAVRLAFGLTALGVAPVSVIDANTRFPAFAELVPPHAHNEGNYFRVVIDKNLWLLTPALEVRQGQEIPSLKAVLDTCLLEASMLLVDLTGYRQLGEHLKAYDLMDGILMLAASGRTREGAIKRSSDEVPQARQLGVLLVG